MEEANLRHAIDQVVVHAVEVDDGQGHEEAVVGPTWMTLLGPVSILPLSTKPLSHNNSVNAAHFKIGSRTEARHQPLWTAAQIRRAHTAAPSSN